MRPPLNTSFSCPSYPMSQRHPRRNGELGIQFNDNRTSLCPVAYMFWVCVWNISDDTRLDYQRIVFFIGRKRLYIASLCLSEAFRRKRTLQIHAFHGPKNCITLLEKFHPTVRIFLLLCTRQFWLSIWILSSLCSDTFVSVWILLSLCSDTFVPLSGYIRPTVWIVSSLDPCFSYPSVQVCSYLDPDTIFLPQSGSL